MANVKEQGYKEERFEFALYVNNNIICKRNFKINDFIEHSMESLEFKEKVDEIVDMIDNDLKSKSRVYTWYFFNPMEPDAFEEYVGKKIEPWECTFKFEVSDKKKVVISKIWDGYAYPKFIRDKVDISNKVVKITSKEGRVYTYDKESFFKSNEDKLSFEHQVLKGMIMDKPDLLLQITKKICETCSTHEDLYSKIGDYTITTYYGKDKDGNEVKYNFNIEAQNRKLERKWFRLSAEDAKKRQEESKSKKQ
jgi:hypothetical protein